MTMTILFYANAIYFEKQQKKVLNCGVINDLMVMQYIF